MLRSAREARRRQAWIRSRAETSTSRLLQVGSVAVAAELARWQFIAATDAAVATAETLAEQAIIAPLAAPIDTSMFAGAASDGRNLISLIQTADTKAEFDRIVFTQLADVARSAASVGVTARPNVGYVRIIGPNACSRCALLAGRFYRWNAGFLRHPNCGCEHMPAVEATAGDVATDPYAYFASLDEATQDKVFTKAGAQAIRDGADINQVVNARRGMTPNGMFTTEGTGRRGAAASGLQRGQRRMTPESIYRQTAGDREKAVELLKQHGYLLPDGQVPGGAIRGQREGFGQLGGGGRRRAATSAVEEARRTGVRDPNNRYTMTAAERRLYDASQRYQTALSGVDPYTSPGFGNTPDPYGLGLNRVGKSSRPATPAVVARAKADYLRWLGSNGQIFTN